MVHGYQIVDVPGSSEFIHVLISFIFRAQINVCFFREKSISRE